MSGISNLKCSFLAEEFCDGLATPRDVKYDQWVWSEVSGCALGYFLPTGERAPTRRVCEDEIVGSIRATCATDVRFNAGSINVDVLPNFGSRGSPVVSGEPRYLMAPERLTL